MSNEHAVLCGSASGARLPKTCGRPLRLVIWETPPNVFFKFEDVRAGLWSDVPDAFFDLLDLAAYVYCADQSIARGTTRDEHFGASWRRVLHFAVPVRLPDLWNRPEVREALMRALSFLSEDEYHFTFEPFRNPPQFDAYIKFANDRFGGTVEEVALFSGGLDSLAGAVQRAVTERRQLLLVHHRSNPKTDPAVQGLVRELMLRAPWKPPIYMPVRLNKDQNLTSESTQRTRSFLFAALGATAAFVLGHDRVSFYENGVVGLNLPPSAQMVGARASRTTHPRVLRRLETLLSLVADRPFKIDNPFLWQTKAQLIRRVADAGCGDLIGLTLSCAYARSATSEQPHCGVCSQCIDRRFAVLAAGQAAHDPAAGYRVDLLTGARGAGRDQTMLAVYAQTAAEVAEMRPAEFFGRFGELSRVVGEVGESPEVAARKAFELYREHGREVNRVVEAGIAGHSADIRRRVLPPSCLLRMVVDDGGVSGAVPADSPDETPAPRYFFRRKGGAWEVRFQGGRPFILLPSKGAAYLHLLLQHAGRPVSAAQLAVSIAKHPERFALGSKGEVMDREGLTAYRSHYLDLQEQFDKARKSGDEVLMGQFQKEMAALLQAIHEASDHRGRPRKTDDRERVRKAVTNAIRRAVKDIAKYDKALGKHLRAPRLQCGRKPCYDPPEGVAWET